MSVLTWDVTVYGGDLCYLSHIQDVQMIENRKDGGVAVMERPVPRQTRSVPPIRVSSHQISIATNTRK